VSTVDPSRQRILFACSDGGHLAQLYRLKPWWSQHDRAWMTFDRGHAGSLLEGERVHWAHYPTTRNLPNLVRNLVKACRVLRRERPTVVVSNGAGVAVPVFVVAWLLRVPRVYIEVYDRIDSQTLTGKLCRPFTSLFVVQWPEQQRLYKDSVVLGPLL
jgi:UDP-N-acetylglucosamine:LPS N-acetylglucosamine transferase